jgi:ABC-type branched-subunit amino acid transport system ATPase component
LEGKAFGFGDIKYRGNPKTTFSVYGIHSILTKEFDNEGIVLSGGETKILVAARVLTSTCFYYQPFQKPYE